MNLILLLSALLSALGGVGQAVRGVRAPQTVCAAVETRLAVARRDMRAVERPVVALPDADDAPTAILTALRLVPAEPIFAGRRRE